MRHVSADDACMDVVLEQKGAGLLIDLNNHDDTLQQVMKQAYVAVGTDGGAVDLSIRDPMVPLVHARPVGILPRRLGHYVREEKLMRLEEAGRRMITLPASIEDPNHYFEGVRYLFVNGKTVVQEGQPTRTFPSRALRRPGYKPGVL